MRPLVVVTGGLGFLGLHLCRVLDTRAVDFVVVDKRTRAAVNADAVEGLGCCLSSLVADVADPCAWDDLDDRLRDYRDDGYKVVALVHLAAETHVDRSLGLDPTTLAGDGRDDDALTDTFLGNAAGAARAATWCARRGVRMVHLSTDEVLGDRLTITGEVDVASEVSRPFPPGSPYAASKVAAEAQVQALVRCAGLDAVIVRPTNLFGAHQSGDKLLPVACARVLRGEPVPLYGDGQHARQWVAVEDVAELIATLALDAPLVRGVVHAPGPLPLVRNADIVAALGHRSEARGIACPAGGWIERAPERPGHDRAYAVESPSRSASALGWVARRHVLADNVLDGLLDAYGVMP